MRKLASAYLGAPLKSDLNRVRNKLAKHLHRGQMQTITDVANISAARRQLEQYLEDSGLRIQTMLRSIS